MRSPQGYAILQSDEGSKEFDTFTCAHCQKITVVKPLCDPVDAGGLCQICDGYVCPTCVDIGTCTPWEKQMEIMEHRAAFHSDFEKAK